MIWQWGVCWATSLPLRRTVRVNDSRLYSTLLQTCSNLAIFHFRQKCLVRFNKQWVPNHSTGHRLLKDWKIHYTCRLLQKWQYYGCLFFSACCILLMCVCSCIMHVNYALKERANVLLAAGSEPTSRTSLSISSLCLLQLSFVLFSPTGKTLEFVHLSWGRRWRARTSFLLSDLQRLPPAWSY